MFFVFLLLISVASEQELLTPSNQDDVTPSIQDNILYDNITVADDEHVSNLIDLMLHPNSNTTNHDEWSSMLLTNATKMVMNKNYRYSALLRKRAVAYLKRVKAQMVALEAKFLFAKKKFGTDTPKLKQQAELLKKVIKLIPEQSTKLKRGVVFKTFRVVHKTFDVSFDMKINNFKGGKWLSVFHMTTGKSYGYGGRIPAVWVNGKDKYVHVCSGVNKNHNYYFNKKVSKDIWIKVQMKQALVKGKYVYSILIDDHLVHSVENKIPRTYKKVTAYVADKWFPALNGLIKNIKIKTP